MKRGLQLTMIGLLLAGLGVNAQTYVNEMTESAIKADCYVEGAPKYNDNADAYYGDGSYVQKSTDAPVSFIFNREICGDKNLTGFIVKAFVPMDRSDWDSFVKIESSFDEENYQDIADMKVEQNYKGSEGNNYWQEIWYQGALPAGTKEIRVTLVTKEDVAEWIPCYNYTELFYEGGKDYSYVKPPYVFALANEFSVDFESNNYILSLGGENSTSNATVVDNPKKDGVNGSEKVLKIVQDPTDSEWGWGNADWFGVAIGLANADDAEGVLTEITADKGRYLHFSILRSENSVFGMETWKGTCTYKNQELPFSGSENWQEMVIDLEEFIGTSFKQFYFSPNEKFGTNAVSVPEITYLDNLFISGSPETSGIESVVGDEAAAKIYGAQGEIKVYGARGDTKVYSVSGTTLYQSNAQGDINISVAPGMYIVKTANVVSKVLVY